MPGRKRTPRQPAERRACGVRLFKENRADCSSDGAACASTPEKRRRPASQRRLQNDQNRTNLRSGTTAERRALNPEKVLDVRLRVRFDRAPKRPGMNSDGCRR